MRKSRPRLCDVRYGRDLSLPTILLLMISAVGTSDIAYSTPSPSSTSCVAFEHRQFDFWVGDWDVMERATPAEKVAYVRVEPILNTCVLHETYEQPDGLKGESYSIFDSTRHQWHQSWVTNRDQLLLLDGHYRDETMSLEGTDRSTDGKARRIRVIWQRDAGGVRETAQRSTDNGATWVTWFDLIFRPHRL